MKTNPNRCRLGFRNLLLAAAAVVAIPTLSAQVVDPDPDLFDGSKTKSDNQDQQQQTTVDDWEGDNLIVYDSNEQGSAQGGMGRAGGQNPGMEMGNGSGGMGGLQIPNPLSGGGIGGGNAAELQIPEGQQQGGGGGGEEEEDPNAKGGGGQQGEMGGQQMAGAPPAPGGQKGRQKPPGDVAIGDQSQRINAVAQAPIGDTEGLEKNAEDSGGDGGDDTRMKAASGQQSGVRGTGVEKGDAIPTDL